MVMLTSNVKHCRSRTNTSHRHIHIHICTCRFYRRSLRTSSGTWVLVQNGTLKLTTSLEDWWLRVTQTLYSSKRNKTLWGTCVTKCQRHISCCLPVYTSFHPCCIWPTSFSSPSSLCYIIPSPTGYSYFLPILLYCHLTFFFLPSSPQGSLEPPPGPYPVSGQEAGRSLRDTQIQQRCQRNTWTNTGLFVEAMYTIFHKHITPTIYGWWPLAGLWRGGWT